jgi:hypothetical protein
MLGARLAVTVASRISEALHDSFLSLYGPRREFFSARVIFFNQEICIMYEMVLKIRDLPDKGVNISLECFQLSPETLTPEKTIDLEAADALG